ncbi:MAG: autotransporter-associated beta strand repeat-containing protein [Verrucomicrobia bacterium]|nr:autotransporter-associated beta strand repeat-containing protein [Verrucomicrobiota bacterium]
MKPRSTPRYTSKAGLKRLLTIFLAVVVCTKLTATSFTWDGGAGDGIWQDGASQVNWVGDVYNPGNTLRNDYVFVSASYAGTSTITLQSSNPNVGNLTINANSPNLTITISTSAARLDLDPSALGAETLTVLSGSHKIAPSGAGKVQLQGQASQTWNIANGASLEIAAVVEGSAGTRGFTKSGLGTLILSAANTYNGGTTLNQGHLQLGVDNTLGSGGLIFAGGILDANNKSFSIGALSLTASSTLNLVNDGGLNGHSLTFNSVSGLATGVLTINGWAGVPQVSGSDDRIFIMGIAPDATFLSHIQFQIGTELFLGVMSGNELVAGVTAVPEPINVALAVFGVVFAGVGFARRLRARRSVVES